MLIETALFTGGTFLGWLSFTTVALPLFYRVPRALYYSASGVLRPTAFVRYLPAPVVWSAIFTATWLVAILFGIRDILYNSQLFWLGQWIGFLYGLYQTTGLSGRVALAADFADATNKYRRAGLELAVPSFSDDDINRTWSKPELAKIPESQLTLLAFLRAIRNMAFFGIQALIVWALVPLLGWIGKIAGWLMIAQFVFMLVTELPAPIMTGILLVGAPNRWRAPQLLISLLNIAYLSVCIFLVSMALSR